MDSAASIGLPRSILRIEGKETFDFLHRMSTNELRNLTDGQIRRTLIVNEKGRVIDFVTVVRTGERAILLASPGAGNDLARWLEKFIIMDDVKITARSDDPDIPSLFGPGTPAFIRKICAAGGPGNDHHDMLLPVPDSSGFVFREDLGTIPAFLYFPGEKEILGETVSISPWQNAEIAAADPATFETVRIEESVPVLGRELGPDVNALEAGLKQYISFSKGCYIGQEVIARLDTYRKLQNILTLFILPGYEGGALSPGRVIQGEREAGRITSTTYSPRHHSWIGLGYRRVQLKDTTFEFIPDLDDRKIPCRCLSGLPNGYEQYEIQE